MWSNYKFEEVYTYYAGRVASSDILYWEIEFTMVRIWEEEIVVYLRYFFGITKSFELRLEEKQQIFFISQETEICDFLNF